VLKQQLPQITGVERARRPGRLPVVLARAEVKAVLAQLSGSPRLVSELLYGAGLRLMEALRLRVKDVVSRCSRLLCAMVKERRRASQCCRTRTRPGYNDT
jgi:site-specific recombinase XerD